MEAPYWIIAFYYIGRIETPQEEVIRQYDFFKERDMMSRIYISKEGINGQMSARQDHAREYIAWMKADPRFGAIDFKIHGGQEHVFPKKTIKVRQQLVAIDCEVDLTKRGQPLSPAEWKRMMEERDEKTLLIDVRNEYEWAIGHFEGADLPPFETFREFPAAVETLKMERDPKKTKVMMYCTGGIRCEFYSALLKKEGFEQVYQLDGGVIGYGLQEGSAHWKGKLFVFDDRLSVGIAKDETPTPISHCKHCNISNDVYYNCANMDCNDLFLCCPDCLHAYRGCCSTECRAEKRVRPYHIDSKPFRKYPFHLKALARSKSKF